TPGERCDVLERRRVGGAGNDDDRVIHGAVLLERRDDLRDRRLLLTDRDVDAGDPLALLVDDRVDRDGALPGLAVADDELALPPTDRRQRVDRLDAGLQRRVDVLPGDDPGRDDVDLRACLVWMGPLPSMARPSGSTTRPPRASPTGTSAMRPVVRTSSPSLIST